MTAPTKNEPQIESVKMEDGRIVDFPGKRKLLKESFTNNEGKVQVRLDFRNGATRLFTIPDNLMAKFAAHGAEQKLGDEIAGLKGTDGKEADIDDAVLAMDELIDRLYNGEWNQRKEANGLAGTSILIRALVELYNGAKSVEQVKAFLKDKTQAEKLALRQSARVKPIVERLEAEKAAKGAKVDADALLAGLDGTQA
jgi:hypothetical protein